MEQNSVEGVPGTGFARESHHWSLSAVVREEKRMKRTKPHVNARVNSMLTADSGSFAVYDEYSG